MKKIKECGILILTFIVCAGIIGSSVMAEEGQYDRRSSLASKGAVEYADGTVVIDSSDLTYLADRIDELERTYKAATVDALNQIGTYYASSDGDISHDPDNNHISSDMAAELSFNDLYQGILKSQSVDHLADVQAQDPDGKPLYYADGSAAESNNLIMTTTEANGLPILIRPASENNLTAGTAAWVNGKLIVGNGADNAAYYSKVEQILYGSVASSYKTFWDESSALSASVTSPTGYGSQSATISGKSRPVYIRSAPDGKKAYITSLSIDFSFGYYSGGDGTGTYFDLYIVNPSNQTIAKISMPIKTQSQTISLFNYDIAGYDYIYLKYTINIQANGYEEEDGRVWSSETWTSMSKDIQLSYLLRK